MHIDLLWRVHLTTGSHTFAPPTITNVPRIYYLVPVPTYIYVVTLPWRYVVGLFVVVERRKDKDWVLPLVVSPPFTACVTLPTPDALPLPTAPVVPNAYATYHATAARWFMLGRYCCLYPRPFTFTPFAVPLYLFVRTVPFPHLCPSSGSLPSPPPFPLHATPQHTFGLPVRVLHTAALPLRLPCPILRFIPLTAFILLLALRCYLV